MKNKFHIFSLIAMVILNLMATSTSNAQLSGYQGKRFSFGMGSSACYAIINQNVNEYSLIDDGSINYEGFILALDYKRQFQAELVVKNDAILGVQYTAGMTRFKDITDEDNVTYELPGETEMLYLDQDYLRMKFHTIGLYYKHFRSPMAPIGRYSAYKASVIFYKPLEEDLRAIPVLLRPTFDYSKTMVLSYSRGSSRVYLDAFIVDANWELGVPIIPMGRDDIQVDNFTNKKEFMQKRMVANMGSRLWGSFLFNVNVNISFLAF